MTPHNKKSGISRRNFIYRSGCAALGCTTLFSSLINMKAIAAAALDKGVSSSGDYRALVCVLMNGGADTHNMLIPRSNSAYQAYATTRSNLAIPQNNILNLNHTAINGHLYGVHPSMPEIRSLFNGGKLSFISNIGTLVEPVTKAQYLANSKPLPLGLFSHSDQAKHWQTGRPGEKNSYGWGGRIADLVQSQNTNQIINMGISLDGTNPFQSGISGAGFAIKSTDNLGLSGYGPSDVNYHIQRNLAIDNILDKEYQDLFEKTYITTLKNGKSGADQLTEALIGVPQFSSNFSSGALSQKFRSVARIIAARESLGFTRQTFFINYTGWDHHDDILTSQEDKVPELSKALGEFQTVLQNMGVATGVTTFTISDFGRTLTSNGNGSDHGWGGNMMVMGGSVNGGQIFGNYPTLSMDNNLMLPRGVVIPTTSSTTYLSELALWFGISPGDVNDIFPDLPNFFNTAGGGFPIGFLNPIN